MPQYPPNARLPDGLARLQPVIELADGLSLGQVCALTGLPPHTVQNWVKRGFVPHPEGKRYRTRQVARLLLIAALRECMRIEQVGALLTYVNGDTDDTADDIVSEERLYDYLCRAVALLDARGDVAQLPALIREITGDYSPVAGDARHRLTAALEAMTCAYMAGRLKQEAARQLEDMQIL